MLLLDEPANGLDPQSIQWMRDFLRFYAGTPLLLLAGGLIVRRLRRQPQHGIHSA